jgi:hypothetical protein
MPRLQQPGTRISRWMPVPLFGALAFVLILAACGSQPVPTAAFVLHEAQTAKITDLSFTAAGTFASSLGATLNGQSGGGSDLTFQANLTGKITMSPQRADLALSLGRGQGVAIEIITDAATQTGYVRLPALDQAGAAQWISVPLGDLASYLDTSIFTNFEHVTQAKMIGPDTINGAAVYHLQGKQQLQQGTGSATEDFYVRQDNAYPVRVVVQGSVSVPDAAGSGTATGPAASIDVTIDFTGVNTGAAITLPSGSQVAND